MFECTRKIICKARSVASFIMNSTFPSNSDEVVNADTIEPHSLNKLEGVFASVQ